VLNQRTLALLILTFLTFATSLSPSARADDWPQWLGPKRDGVWRETGLIDAFPKEGPVVRWRATIGSGYGGPAVTGGRVYVMDRELNPGAAKPKDPFQRVTVPGTERVVCLDESDGKVIWAHEYDCPYGFSYGAGPRATPAVDGKFVYTFGAEGDLLCLDADTGNLVWSQKLSGDKRPTPRWGFGGSPLVDGDKVINPTGDPAGVLAAFDKKTGKVLWSALPAKEPGYSSPVIYDVAGKRQLIQWDPVAVNSLDPETGKVYWSVKQGPANLGMSIVTPRLCRDPQLGDLLFVTSQYEGSLMLKLGQDEKGEPNASVLWKRAGKSEKKTDALHTVFAAPLLRDGHIYGCDLWGELRCLDAKNGDRVWESTAATTYDAGQQKWSSTFIIPLGDTGSRCLLPNEHGDLIFADLTPLAYKEISRTHLIEPANRDPGRPVVWSEPAFADRCIFWRNDKELVCASLAAK
jgi:outer membrane protein assembly factor BamB